jgi:hypothetical protein
MNNDISPKESLNEKIITDIYENVEDPNKSSEIIGDVNTLTKSYMYDINALKGKIQRLNDEASENVKEAERVSERAEKLSIHFKNLLKIRGYLNQQFRIYWNRYESKIKDELTQEMLCSQSKREHIYDDSGYKFAVYVLCIKTLIPELAGFSKELCEFYIKLNDKIHPNFLPRIITMNAVRELKESINDPLIKEYNITIEVLNDIEMM